MTTNDLVLPTVTLSTFLFLLGSSACSSTFETLSSTADDRTASSHPPTVEVRCGITSKDEKHINIRYEIRNLLPQTIHIVDSKRMPYELLRGVNTLVILHGLNPPRPGVFYNVMEMPVTRSLPTNDIFVGNVMWPMETMHDHYGGNATPADLLRGAFRVRCEIGWWTMPITKDDRVRLSFTEVLRSQNLAGDGPLDVTLP